MNQLGILRSIAVDELELMRAWRNEPAVRANMFTQHEISYEEHLIWWEKTKVRTDQKYFMYEMAGAPVGIAAFTGIDIRSQNSAWAFYASPSAPKGTGSKMEFLMLDHAFDDLKIHKLYCEVLAFNKSVIKLHQKFGFRIEGVFKQQYKVNDNFVDIYRLGILASEWQEHRQSMQEKLITQKRA
ncbi:UDP-4-amino-4,6-dideoxy-N-acetyl-beta-L-altrosamine N-acetyltransferase [Comamonas aquatica]|uniref:UDP-4-amino-4, 6-dideoxy-N-acetyl-beta-L-altrosamine N-acetyltransferase n=1 Tax=Comamonas aquatica TaxID=225991 RepID=A0AA42L0L5_9BURK|nr:UDP-4-amino-4,6-dideoxy-N-acetyl-beta-L-altrosamine N-acetyltransferase [Comamonas aquatica]MDH0364472.1 UDP-4-amino-4,6-dideoxy-N-acetyl-beta-L-altrosamine N-acetyltransferase [Comamonas aquatica]